MYSDLWLLDVIKSIEPLIYGAPPSPTSRSAFGRRLFANGTSDCCGLPRLLPEASNKIDGEGDGAESQDDTTRPDPSHRAVTALESDAEHFDLETVSSDDSDAESDSVSGSERLSRNPNFRKQIVRIRMSPVLPEPKAKPS